MLFQAVVIFLPILNCFQISCKMGKVHSNVLFEYGGGAEGECRVLLHCACAGNILRDFVTQVNELITKKDIKYFFYFLTCIKILIH